MTEEEITAKITFLRKQRDGLVIGTYRNTLVNAYREIEKELSGQGVCCVVSFCEEHGTTDHGKNLLKDYCLDLEQLRYIKIDETGNIFVTKSLDF